VGVVVKHRQLVHQVGVFIEHPLENLMASFNFTSAMLDEGQLLYSAPGSALPTAWVASIAT
jgi:hypothetical protein